MVICRRRRAVVGWGSSSRAPLVIHRHVLADNYNGMAMVTVTAMMAAVRNNHHLAESGRHKSKACPGDKYSKC
jgi:hypothetical protein